MSRSTIQGLTSQSLGTRLAQKCEFHGKADRRLLGILRKSDDFLFHMESVARVVLRRENLHGPLCEDDTYILFFFFKKKKAWPLFLMTRQGFEVFGMTPVQG